MTRKAALLASVIKLRKATKQYGEVLFYHKIVKSLPRWEAQAALAFINTIIPKKGLRSLKTIQFREWLVISKNFKKVHFEISLSRPFIGAEIKLVLVYVLDLIKKYV